jgi:hypothetical protein
MRQQHSCNRKLKWAIHTAILKKWTGLKTDSIQRPRKLRPVLGPQCDLEVQVASEEEGKKGLIEFDFFGRLFSDGFNTETPWRRMVEWYMNDPEL